MDNNKDIHGPLVENIRRLRKEAGLTQTEVAYRIGIKQATYSAMERGKQKIFADYLPSIAEALGIKIADLFNEEAQPIASADTWAQKFLQTVVNFNDEEKAVLMNMAHLIEKKHCPGDENECDDCDEKPEGGTILKNQSPKKTKNKKVAG